MTLLGTAARLLLPILLLFSLILLFLGHDEPGGGFVGGMVAGLALALHALAFDTAQTLEMMRVSPRLLIAAGLATMLGSVFLGAAAGGAFLDALWIPGKYAALGHIGSPVLFDVGIYLAVTGAFLLILFSLMGER